MPPRRRIRTGSQAWRAALARGKELVGPPGHRPSLQSLIRLAPFLIDSAYRTALEAHLSKADPAAVTSSAELSFAAGRSLVLAHHADEALTHLLRAQALTTPGSPLFARSTWEIGCIYLERGELAAAEIASATADEAQGDEPVRSPDLAHLQALLYEARGQAAQAEERYRYAIARSARALTPYTRVAALRNLAAALTQREPDEAASLCGLALAVIEADQIDARLRPAILNILGYALLCLGRINDARERLLEAAAEAHRFGATRAGLYARFNLAITQELDGDLRGSRGVLEQVFEELAPSDELRGWCAIRLAWVALRSGEPERAQDTLDSAQKVLRRRVYADSLEACWAIIACLQGSLQEAIGRLSRSIAAHDERTDLLTPLALRLWLAYAYDRAGRRDGATRMVEAALAAAQVRGLRLSPNYWHPLLNDIAKKYAPPRLGRYAADLVRPTNARDIETAPHPKVRIATDGLIWIDERAMEASRWRIGRTGHNVLRRLFGLLVAAYPTAIQRDKIADLLWPDSDGDRAVANLYSAMNDLRHFLDDVPGLALDSSAGGYRLHAERNVEFERPSAGTIARTLSQRSSSSGSGTP